MQKRHETHQLHILLLETFISVLLALLTYALAYYDSHLLYHLVAKKLTNECWGVVFGGAVRSLMKVTTGASEENGQRFCFGDCMSVDHGCLREVKDGFK